MINFTHAMHSPLRYNGYLPILALHELMRTAVSSRRNAVVPRYKDNFLRHSWLKIAVANALDSYGHAIQPKQLPHLA